MTHLLSRARGQVSLVRALVVLGFIATGLVSVVSYRLATALALLLFAIGATLYSRALGVVVLALYWLLIPFLRRLLGLTLPFTATDALSVLPFVATLVVAIIVSSSASLSARLRMVIALAVLGLAIGIPAGLGSPSVAAYGALAYGTALSAIVIGYVDQLRSPRRSPFLGSLLVLIPVLSLYGIYQYFVSPPSWDAIWLSSVDTASFFAPEEGRVRVFATLNAPSVFAFLLTIGALGVLSLRQLTPWRIVSLALVLTALALTFVRAAWLALAVGALACAVSGGKGARAKVLIVAGLAVAVGLYASARTATGDAVLERAASATEIGADVSAQQRLSLTQELFRESLTAPVGHGIGQAGLPSTLGESGGLRRSDNGYAALIYQVGPVGFALVMLAVLIALKTCVRVIREKSDHRSVAVGVLTIIAACLAFEFFTDILYGVAGVTFWYMCGQALALGEARGREETSAGSMEEVSLEVASPLREVRTT